METTANVVQVPIVKTISRHVRWLYTRTVGLRDDVPLRPDPVIEVYKREVDRTLLRQHLRLTPQERIEKLMAFMRDLERLRDARRRSR